MCCIFIASSTTTGAQLDVITRPDVHAHHGPRHRRHQRAGYGKHLGLSKSRELDERGRAERAVHLRASSAAPDPERSADPIDREIDDVTRDVDHLDVAE